MWRVRSEKVGDNGNKATCRHGAPWFAECAWCREPEPLRCFDFWFRFQDRYSRPIVDWYYGYSGQYALTLEEVAMQAEERMKHASRSST
jgi:hypothetical protein